MFAESHMDGLAGICRLVSVVCVAPMRIVRVPTLLWITD